MKVLILLLMPCLVFGATKWFKETVCDSESKTIQCDADQKISIEKAFYGRANDYTCPSPDIRTTKCEATNTVTILGNNCNGKAECTIEASTTYLGDPCEGTSKYLEIQYTCITPSKFPTVVICEGYSETISCPEGKVIKVKKGFYGRHGWLACSHPATKDVFCTAHRSQKKLKRICQGQNECTVTATNSLFGDPCRGTYKYVEMSYKCVKQEEEVTEPTCLDEDGNPISSDPFEKPGDCNNFYQCSNGNLHVMPCAPGTVFNPDLGVCDWPSNVPGC